MSKRPLAWAVPLVSLGAVVMVGGLTPVSAHALGDTARHAYGPVTYPGSLMGVSAVSASSVWAVGFHDDDQQVSSTLVEHWDGRHWGQVSTPHFGGGGGSSLWGVSAVSDSDVWAVGNYYDGAEFATLVEHWDGSAWTPVASPSPGGADGSYLLSVSARSATDVWAVGHTYDGPLIEHWDGMTWSVVASPGGVGVELSSVSAVGSNDAVAVGNTFGAFSRTFILHWDGTSWNRQDSAKVDKRGHADTLNGVSADSSTDAWTVGTTTSWRHVVDTTLIEHWDGTSWQRVPGVNPGGALGTGLSGVSAVSASDVWAVGSFGMHRSGVFQTFIEHWNGTSWRKVHSAKPAGSYDSQNTGIDALSPNRAWAGGYSSTGTGEQTMTQNWDGTRWIQL